MIMSSIVFIISAIYIEKYLKENIIAPKDKEESNTENNSTNYAINKITSAISNSPQNVYR